MPWSLALPLLILVVGLAALVAFTRRGVRWGATPEECTAPMTGDDWLWEGPAARVRMTRAITIRARPAEVWPWLAQLGRGAGWYSIDRLDNGGRTSARHLITWVPAPRPGDATTIGYLRHLEPGREIVWWIPDTPAWGARACSVMAYTVGPTADGSRVVVRMSAAATGLMRHPAMAVYRVIDSIMARRQLLNLRQRVERFGTRTADPEAPETGERDQYQLYQVLYSAGGEAGVPGREEAAAYRRVAREDGLLAPVEAGPRPSEQA